MTLQNKYITDLTSTERHYIDNKYKLKIYSSNGQVFEDFFTSVMFACDSRFVKVKAWGSLGDRKNDGCIPDDGIYYQIYAPEDINLKTTQYNSLCKLKEDSAGLISHWGTAMPNGVKIFEYVINNKFGGTHPDLLPELEHIKTTYSLDSASIFTADHLRLKFIQLPILEIENLLEMVIPNIDEFRIVNIKCDIINEVLNYISKKDASNLTTPAVAPDWDDKIKFNNLGKISVASLEQGDTMIPAVDECLQSKEFSADTLQKLMTEVYLEVKKDFENITDSTGDDIFWEIINRCIPVKSYLYQVQMFPIMAKYFATCDIFEEPRRV